LTWLAAFSISLPAVATMGVLLAQPMTSSQFEPDNRGTMPIGAGIDVDCFSNSRGFIYIEYEYDYELGIRNTPAFGHELNATEH